MGVEWVIAFYLAVCLMMMLFNGGFVFYECFQSYLLTRRSRAVFALTNHEVKANIARVSSHHLQSLEKRLENIAGLESFDKTMESLETKDSDLLEEYLKKISLVFERTAARYERASELNRAYFSFVIKRWYRPADQISPRIVAFLLRCVRSDSLYTRQNAFEALSVLGDTEGVIEALLSLDKHEEFHHPRLVTETLLLFSGSKEHLVNRIQEYIPSLSSPFATALVNFIRLAQVGRYGIKGEASFDRFTYFLDLLTNESCNKELRLACIRYFMSNPWDKALPVLQSFALRDGAEEWEFAAVAAIALVAYPGKRTEDTLKQCLSSRVWFVRYNAAKSLYALGLSLETDLSEIVQGSDDYARDMVNYRWQLESDKKDQRKEIS